MTSKKACYLLDNIGFIGIQEKRSIAQQKKDAIKTAEIIGAMKVVSNDTFLKDNRTPSTK